MARFFIDRPIVAMVISIIMVILGVVSMLRLPIALFPEIAPPEILVQATYVGADALTAEAAVATPIEQKMSGVDNMIYMYSTNASNGQTSLRVDFEVGTVANIDQVLTQMRYDQAESQLPSDVRNYGVTVLKSTTSPLALFSIYSPDGSHDALFLSNYAYINVNDPMTRVSGVGQVQIFGAGQYAMRFWVDPDTLAKLGITVSEITSAIKNQNTVNPAGQVGAEPIPKGQEFQYTVRAQGRLETVAQFEEIVVRANPDGSIVRLKDVARIELGSQTYSEQGRLNGSPSAIVAIYQSPGSNAIATVDAATALMEELKSGFPEGVEYVVSLDTTLAVREGIREIVVTLFQALALVILVVYIFLQGVRATLIPLLAVPVSLVGTFVAFPLLGFSINTLSLFGLVLAIGLVVDDAIVVVEAVEHHIEEGLSAREAALKAMSEVSAPVVAIALILVAVFIPTAFIPGITGLLYQQFAVTIAVSVVFSAFNALTLSPALSALLLKPRREARGPLGRFFAWFNRGFGRATDGYVRTCGLAIRKVGVSLLLLLGITALAGVLGSRLPGGFLPEEDQGYFYMNVQLPPAASLQRTAEVCTRIEEILEQAPGVQTYNTIVGFSLLSTVQTSYNAFFFVTLEPWDERDPQGHTADSIMAHLNAELSQLPEAVAFAFPPPAIPGVGTSGGVNFILEDRSGGSVSFLAEQTDKFMAALRQRPEFARVSTTLLPSVPQLFAEVDRDKALKQGVDLGDLYETLQAFMGGTFVNYFNRFGRTWQVYVQAEGKFRTDARNVGQFFVRNSSDQMVPLSTLVDIRETYGPEFTFRFNEYRSAQIMIGTKPGVSSGQAMQVLEDVFAATMPSQMGYDYFGMSFQEKVAEEGVSPTVVFGFSLLMVFLILAAQYESWSLPFSVLLGTPVAVFGAFAGLTLRGFDNNVYAQIGLVMLIGLAAKNAILIVEFARSEREGGKSISDAALTAARLRLRPILMTAFAFILGVVPLAIASGAGAEGRRILGTGVIGGMLAATLIAIFLIPVTFYVVERLSSRGKGPEAPAQPAPRTRECDVRPRLRAAGVVLAALCLSACAIGPNYERPEIASPPQYRGWVDAPEAASLADLPWWEVFADPALVDLAVAAIEHNLDLVQATARVEQSRALLGAARSEFFPQIGYTGHGGRSRLPLTAKPGEDHTTFNSVFGAFSLAWEIDVWGRVRRANEAARAQLFAADSFRRGVLLSLVSEVAGAYFELIELDWELEIARRSTEAFRETRDLFERRYQGGVGSKLQTTRAEAALADAASAIPELERRITATENRISVLVARPPGAVSRGKPLLEQETPPQTPPGLPAQLLERRPDIVQAEEDIVAANARVGVAMGNFLPRIGLTAVYGGASSELKDLVTGSASLWNVLGEMAGPLFQGGLRLSEYRARKSAWEESKARYEQTVLTALAEVSDALVAQEKLAEERAQRERQVQALSESVDLALLRYRQGLATYYEVLDAQEQLFPAERLLARARRDQLNAVVQLYRALGGGWKLDAGWLPAP